MTAGNFGRAAVAPLGALAVWLGGCASSMNPIYDAPDQLVQVEQLEGNWAAERGDALLRIEPAEFDGLPGYRMVYVEEHRQEHLPPVLVLRLLVGTIDDKLVGEVSPDWEQTAERSPEIEAEELDRWLVTLRQERLMFARLLFQVHLEDDGQTLALAMLNVQRMVELIEAEDEAPLVVREPQEQYDRMVHLVIDDEPEHVRDFLRTHAEQVWLDPASYVRFSRPEAEEVDRELERLTAAEAADER